MNIHPSFKAYWQDVAEKLIPLACEAGKVNLFFVSDPEQGEGMIQKLRQRLSLPCLLVEFYDETTTQENSSFTYIPSAFVVLAQYDKNGKGDADMEAVIYEQCKPLADAIQARMQLQADKRQIRLDGKVVHLMQESEGNWVGPVQNNLVGWRKTFTWRIGAEHCHNPDLWLS